MHEEKKYYNQYDVAKEIHYKTGYSQNDVLNVINSLGDVVKDKISNNSDFVEIKLFSGLKITSKYISPEQSKSNLNIKDSEYILKLSANFTDNFRKKVRQLHNKKESELPRN